MSFKSQLRRVLWKLGYDVIRYKPASHPIARMQQLLRSYGVETVLDVGANSGQFGRHLRKDLGYTKNIISFEPLSSAFSKLEHKARNDSKWDAYNMALGDFDGQSEINIAGNSFSSSLLDMLPSHEKSAPGSKYDGKESIEVKKMDTVFDGLNIQSSRLYMKMDTQGFESKVLKGAENTLNKIDTIQMEMSLLPLYQGEHLFSELYRYMEEKGYTLVAIIPGFADQKTGQLLQVDGIFHRLK